MVKYVIQASGTSLIFCLVVLFVVMREAEALAVRADGSVLLSALYALCLLRACLGSSRLPDGRILLLSVVPLVL